MSENFSKRIKTRILSPKFYENKQSSDIFLSENRAGSFTFTIRIVDKPPIIFFGLIDKNQTPQQLVAMKYTCEEKNIFTGFVEGFIELIMEKDESTIDKLAFREVESFLRDQNNIPAVVNKETALYALFESIKKSLADTFGEGQSSMRNGIKASPTIKNDYSPSEITLLSQFHKRAYQELDIHQKQSLISQIISRHISPVLKRDAGDCHCVFADDFMIVIEYTGACATCNYSLSSTMNFIQQVLRHETENHQLQVMTDS